MRTRRGPPSARVIVGDCREKLAELRPGSHQCCVTSPPYWGLREYDHEDQIGLEPTVEEYVDVLTRVFRLVRRVLADDGTLWVNLGDTYASGNRKWLSANRANTSGVMKRIAVTPAGLKGKDLVGVPWLVAFALRADGWYLRADVVWHKPNCLPESVQDRPTLDYEHVFLLSKSDRYFYDAGSIREPAMWGNHWRREKPIPSKAPGRPTHNGLARQMVGADMRNARSVWSIACDKSPDSNAPAFPIELPRRCVLAGSRRGDYVLDPFAGSGTTGQAAVSLGRYATLIELSAASGRAAMDRTAQLGL